jgi:hypothetical protein
MHFKLQELHEGDIMSVHSMNTTRDYTLVFFTTWAKIALVENTLTRIANYATKVLVHREPEGKGKSYVKIGEMLKMGNKRKCEINLSKVCS